MSPRRVVAILLTAAALPAAPTPAAADDGDGARDDVRTRVVCSGASRGELRVRERDGGLRVELSLSTPRRGAVWTAVVVHERRIAYRGRVRTAGGSGSLSLRRTVANWFGEDTVVVRASGPGGETCSASATL